MITSFNNLTFRQRARRFAVEDGGATAVMFAGALMGLLLMIGGAIDFSVIYKRRTELQSAADAAVLSAVKVAAERRAAGDAAWRTKAAEAGQSAFSASVAQVKDVAVSDVDFRLLDNNARTDGTLTYAAQYAPSFLPLAALGSLRGSGQVAASIDSPDYIDVHFLIDVSSSMGIGATVADQQRMYSAVGCAVTCHYNTPGGGDNYTGVRASGSTLRIDVVRAAVRQFIADVRTRQSADGVVRVSIDLFSNQVIPLLAPSTDLTAADAAAQQIDLKNPAYNEGTNIAYAMRQLASRYPAGGDGRTPGQRKSYVVLLSDGIENSTYGLPSGTPGTSASEIKDPNFVDTAPAHVFTAYETIQTINPASCDILKSARHTVVTGHIEYLIPPSDIGGADYRFELIRTQLIGRSIEAFRGCASDPGLAYNAVTTNDLMAMLGKVTDAILRPKMLRLTR